jgi:predicted unusual protein kinase regulating ubiquinone biosynthesis (AarF/ABC1/UbiB family)
MLADVFLGNSVKRNRAYADRDLIEEFSDDLPRTLRANPIVEVPADVLLVNRVLGLMSGLGKTLDSQVNLFATLMPFTQSLMSKMPEPTRMAGNNETAQPPEPLDQITTPAPTTPPAPDEPSES